MKSASETLKALLEGSRWVVWFILTIPHWALRRLALCKVSIRRQVSPKRTSGYGFSLKMAFCAPRRLLGKPWRVLLSVLPNCECLLEFSGQCGMNFVCRNSIRPFSGYALLKRGMLVLPFGSHLKCQCGFQETIWSIVHALCTSRAWPRLIFGINFSPRNRHFWTSTEKLSVYRKLFCIEQMICKMPLGTLFICLALEWIFGVQYWLSSDDRANYRKIVPSV